MMYMEVTSSPSKMLFLDHCVIEHVDIRSYDFEFSLEHGYLCYIFCFICVYWYWRS